jgi:hypothetical protein
MHYGFRTTHVVNELRQTAVLTAELQLEAIPDAVLKLRKARSFHYLWPDYGIGIGRRAYRCWKARRRHQWRAPRIQEV